MDRLLVTRPKDMVLEILESMSRSTSSHNRNISLTMEVHYRSARECMDHSQCIHNSSSNTHRMAHQVNTDHMSLLAPAQTKKCKTCSAGSTSEYNRKSTAKAATRLSHKQSKVRKDLQVSLESKASLGKCLVALGVVLAALQEVRPVAGV